MRIVNREAGLILSRPNAVDLILFISVHGAIQARSLRDVHPNYTRMRLLAQDLEESGILRVVETRAPRKILTIRLTPKGEKVAEKLREAKAIMGER